MKRGAGKGGEQQVDLGPAFANLKPKRPASVFEEHGFKATVDLLVDEIRRLYLEDTIPWVVGYSGGKDSSTTLSLVWYALKDLHPEQRRKTVHVISTDTLVENPAVAVWANTSLARMREAANVDGLPIEVHRLSPTIDESFWVMLIGRGYPAPHEDFRWCTDRMKIRPSTAFLASLLVKHGTAIVVLGTRKAESAGRKARMEKLEGDRVRERLSPNVSQPGTLVYSPIEEWSNDDVWMYLMQYTNPWGHDNHQLLGLYRGASPDNECPVVMEKGTPSCGGSRFGCWTCTVVEQDKSLEAMVRNEEAHEWMAPLLDLRNKLKEPNYHLRDFRRMSGLLQLRGKGPHKGEKLTPGPYIQSAREMWLREVLEAQQIVRRIGPDPALELISFAELEEIRRIWVIEKKELEDMLPRIYLEVRGEVYPGEDLDFGPFSPEDMALLRDSCDGEEAYKLARTLLGIVIHRRQTNKRAGVYDEMDKAIRRHLYRDEEEATAAAKQRSEAHEEVRRDVAKRQAAASLREASVRLEGEPSDVMREAAEATEANG